MVGFGREKDRGKEDKGEIIFTSDLFVNKNQTISNPRIPPPKNQKIHFFMKKF